MKTHQSLYGTLQGRTGEAGFTKGSSCNNRAIHTRKNLCFLTKSTIRCWWPLGNWNVAISGDFGHSPVAWESPAHHSVGTGLAVKFHGEKLVSIIFVKLSASCAPLATQRSWTPSSSISLIFFAFNIVRYSLHVGVAVLVTKSKRLLQSVAASPSGRF